MASTMRNTAVDAAHTAFRRMPGWARRAVVSVVAPSFTVGALVVLLDGRGNAVFVRQGHTSGWTLPGGLLDKGEPPHRAVDRELAEELGLGRAALGIGEAPTTAYVDAPRQRVDLIYSVGIEPAVVDGVAGTEGLQVAWRPLSEADVSLATKEILAWLRVHLPGAAPEDVR